MPPPSFARFEKSTQGRGVGLVGSQLNRINLRRLKQPSQVGLSPFLRRKRVDRLGSQAREAAGELGAFAVDSVQGLGEIVAFQQATSRGTKLDPLSQRHISLRMPLISERTLQLAGFSRRQVLEHRLRELTTSGRS